MSRKLFIYPCSVILLSIYPSTIAADPSMLLQTFAPIGYFENGAPLYDITLYQEEYKETPLWETLVSVETAGTGLFIGGSGIAILAFVPFLIAERTIETNQMNATGSPIENQVDVEDARTLHALTASITIGGISIAGIGFILWLTGAISQAVITAEEEARAEAEAEAQAEKSNEEN